MMRRRIHECHMAVMMRRIHACDMAVMRRRIHACHWRRTHVGLVG
jgi:hypothetical protein